MSEHQDRDEFFQGKAKRNRFSPEEDMILFQLVKAYGTCNWRSISQKMKTKTTRQCKERWIKFLDPSINNEDFTLEEDEFLLQQYAIHGSKWKLISSFFKGRTDIQIRNRFSKLKRNGIVEEYLQRYQSSPETQSLEPQDHFPFNTFIECYD